jgi:hypothetical protein
MLPTDLIAKLNQCAASDFSTPRDHWFSLLAGFTTMVAIGLVFELPELAYELRTIARDRIPYFRFRIITREKREQAAKVVAFVGWVLIVAGVAGERVAEVNVKDFDTSIQECSDAKVRAATLEAGDAQTSANGAAIASAAARSDARTAKNESEKAKINASSAFTIASGARAEADSFEADIASAKKQAADAESHLRDALELSKEVHAELERVRSPRSLSQYSKAVEGIRPFKNTEYVFSGVSADKEAVDFLLEIDDFLRSAGWKRGKSLSGFPGINPRGKKEPDFSVPDSLSAGVQISVESQIPQATLDSMPQSLWPQNVLAAVRLNESIFGNTMPPPRPSDRLSVLLEIGSSETVRIDVGRRP